VQPYSQKSDQDLQRIARGILDNEIFSTEDIRDPADIPEVFAILKMARQTAIAYIQAYNIKYMWTWRRDATGVRHKEYDVYPGCGLLDATDYARLVKVMYNMKIGDERHESNVETGNA